MKWLKNDTGLITVLNCYNRFLKLCNIYSIYSQYFNWHIQLWSPILGSIWCITGGNSQCVPVEGWSSPLDDIWPPPSTTLYIYEIIERNKLIDTIPTWGPLFSISFDLIINSYGSSSWLTILSFKANNASSNVGNFGDRIPAMHLNGGKLYFKNAVGENPNYAFYNYILTRKWYNIQT